MTPIVPGGPAGPAMVDRVRVQVADRLTTNLRDFAAKAGWPTQLVQNIRVLWRGNTWSVDIPSEIRDAVDDLEYGTPTQAPNPAIRRFTARMGELADQAAGSALINLGDEVLS